VSIALGGGAPHEPSDVLWLQARRGFADVRVPSRGGVEPAAFAGTTTWEPPALTWHHRLDFAPATSVPAPEAPDVGAVEWRGGDLVERGTMLVDGVLTPYEEVWRREVGAVAPVVVLARGAPAGACAGILVQIGADAIVIAATDRGLAARRDRRDGAHWWTVGSVGPATLLPAIPEVAAGWVPGATVDLEPARGEQRRTSWCVVELEA
jgi:Protein HRI1